MPSVAWVTGDWNDGHGPGGLSQNRCLLPARALNQRAGWRTGTFRHMVIGDDGRIHPYNKLRQLDDGRILPVLHSEGWDVVIFQRWSDRDAAERIRTARAAGQVVGNDLDDWLYGTRGWNPYQGSIRRGRDEDNNALHYSRALAAGDFVICSTPELAARLSKRMDVACPVAHNMIDLDYWEPPNEPRWPPRTVGWVGSVPYHVGDAAAMRGVLGPILDRHGLGFVHGGWRPSEQQFADLAGLGPDVPLDLRAPAPITNGYRRLFDGIDIGISPLEAFSFNDCKSWLKLTEFSAAGIPTVCSDAAAYRELGHPFRAARPADWRRLLERLICDRESWEWLRAWQLERVASLDYRIAYREWEAVLGAYLRDVPLSGGKVNQ